MGNNLDRHFCICISFHFLESGAFLHVRNIRTFCGDVLARLQKYQGNVITHYYKFLHTITH